MKKSKNTMKKELIIESKLKIPEEIKKKMRLEMLINETCEQLPSDYPDPYLISEINEVMVDMSGFLKNDIRNFFSPIITNLLPNKVESIFLLIDGYIVFRRAPSKDDYFVFLLGSLEYILYKSYIKKCPILHIAL